MQRIIAKVKASPEERARRLTICMDCKWATVGKFMGEDYAKCGHCGCPLASRTYFKHSHCPIKEW